MDVNYLLVRFVRSATPLSCFWFKFAGLALTFWPIQALAVDGNHWAETFGSRYAVSSNITYIVRSGEAQKLDVYRVAAPGQHPTVLLFHGGGWMAGDKSEVLEGVLPWLARGWNVINANYRLGSTAHAPAAVEDARCALQWLEYNANSYGIDPQRIVVTGYSAGGHLALMAALLPAESVFGNSCSYGLAIPPELAAQRTASGASSSWWTAPVRICAIVNFFGITDLAPLLHGADAKTYARAWLGARANELQLVDDLSPITYVRTGIPPIITIHGDRDPIVPYTQAEALHQALKVTGLPNQLLTVPGGKHGEFTAAERQRVWDAIDRFLGGRSTGLTGC